MGFIEEEEKNAELDRARKRAMYLLGSRDYSTAALREKLLNNYSEETADKVIGIMKDYGFLDDEAYGKKLAAALIKGKKYGVYRARGEMKRKGVPDDIIQSALGEYEQEDYLEQLKALIRKKYGDKLSDREDRQKTVAALARRGYGFTEIKKAVISVMKEDCE